MDQQKQVTSGVTAVHTVAGPPLDYSAYSLKDLKGLLELKAEEALAASKEDKKGKDDKKNANNTAANQQLATQNKGLVSKKVLIKKVSTSVKLNNNLLENLQNLPEAMDAILKSPFERLEWLDLSFNFLTTVEPVLLKYPNLKAIYMHGNKIKQLASVEKLAKLENLMSLTMNGNPIENNASYRVFIVAAVPQLKSLDHSTITADEQEMADDWWQGFLTRRDKRREEREEAAYKQGLAE